MPFCLFSQGVTTPGPSIVPTSRPTPQPTITPSQQPSAYFTSFVLGTVTLVTSGNTYDPDNLLDLVQSYLTDTFSNNLSSGTQVAVQLFSLDRPTPLDGDGSTTQIS